MHNFRNKITYLSFLMAILIVCRHCVNISIYNISGSLYYFQLFISHLTDTIVPCFFAISGYLFYQNFNYSLLRNKLGSRIKTIVIPFIVWNIIGYLFYFGIQSLMGDKMNMEIPPFHLVHTFLDVFFYTKYNVTWFLLNLIVYTYTFPLLYRLFKSFTGGISLNLIFLILGYVFHNSFVMYAVPYAMGVFFGIHYKELVQQKYNNSLLTIAAILFVFSILIETYFDFEQGPMLMPLRLLQIILIWVVADKLAINNTPKWWMLLSFFIYCSHSLILESYEKMILLLLGDTPTGALIDFIVAPMLTFMTIYLLAVILRKRPVVWGILTGGR